MRKIIFTLILIAMASSDKVLSYTEPCKAKELAQISISKIPEGFNFLKSYDIDNDGGSKDKIEFSYVFTKGTSYTLTICTKDKDEAIVMTIFDSGRNKIASNVIKDQVVPSIAFASNATGIYYMQYTFKDQLPHCAGCSVGFKR